jgi:transcriptional regulator with XRE-family HTH domain
LLGSSIGLTQTGLADLLGVSRRAVGEWEAGGSYPKASHLKQVIALGCNSRSFRPGARMSEPPMRPLFFAFPRDEACASASS